MSSDPTLWADIKDVATIVTAAIALSGFLFGLLKYSQGLKWKKAELAGKQLELLSTDEYLVLSCLFLDYSARRIVVPERYSSLTREPTFVHTWGLLVDALKPEQESGKFPWPQIVYRDAFDRCFGYLERIEHFIRIGLINAEDVASLDYWLRQIAAPRFAPAAERCAIMDFVEAYGYRGVIALMERFGVEPAPRAK